MGHSIPLPNHLSRRSRGWHISNGYFNNFHYVYL